MAILAPLFKGLIYLRKYADAGTPYADDSVDA